MEPILITGAARSGTSMVAGIIDRCGAQGGSVLGPTPHNKRGQYENRTIVDQIIKPYLRLQGYDPLGQSPLPDVKNLLPFDNLRQRFQKILVEQGVDLSRPYYFKGAKLCLIWPVIHKAFPKAKWIIVRRDREQIVASCLRTGFMRKRQTAASWGNWVDHHVELFGRMAGEGLDVREVWPKEFFVGDFLEIRDVIQWLGLRWNGNAVVDFVSPALWNGGK